LFIGGWRGLGAQIDGAPGAIIGLLWLFGKSMVIYLLQMLVRNTVPRVRIDHMMAFNWKVLVPLSLGNLLIIAFWAKLFQVDYNAVSNAAQLSKGIMTAFYDFFGRSVLAELPRDAALLISNLVLWWVVSVLLHRYANLERRTAIKVTEPAPYMPGK